MTLLCMQHDVSSTTNEGVQQGCNGLHLGFLVTKESLFDFWWEQGFDF